MEMFLVAVGFYGIGVLTMLLPHGMQRAAHWLANSAALFRHTRPSDVTALFLQEIRSASVLRYP